MTDSSEVLRRSKEILVVDWPSSDVPETLTAAGYSVIVKGGPEPDNYSTYEIEDGGPLGRPPGHIDLVYCHRPVEELPGLAALAADLGAHVVWLQSGRTASGELDPTGCWLPQEQRRQAQEIVQSYGLALIDDVYIADAIRDRNA